MVLAILPSQHLGNLRGHALHLAHNASCTSLALHSSQEGEVL